MPESVRPFRIGTRGSPLALVQSEMVRSALCRAHGWSRHETTIVPIHTVGDAVQDRPLADIGGKALWTKELDRALLTGEIDCAVHSLKDVETIRPQALNLAAFMPRADTRERLIGAPSIAGIAPGARVGTASPRRRAQLLHFRPDLEIVTIRGNVDTRLRKVAEGQVDATLLAAAGLDRLGHTDVGVAVRVEELLPAPSQGAVGVECASHRLDVIDRLSAIDDRPTRRCVSIERRFLELIGGGCHSPVAALATEQSGQIHFQAEILSENGRDRRALDFGFAFSDLNQLEKAAAMIFEDAPKAITDLFHPSSEFALSR